MGEKGLHLTRGRREEESPTGEDVEADHKPRTS